MTRTVQRSWANFIPAQSSVYDPFYAFYLSINDLVTDAAAMQTGTSTVVTDIKTAINLDRTLLLEVQTEANAIRTLANELQTLLNQIRQSSLYECLANPAFVISTNFDTKNGNAISYLNGGTLKTLSANTNFDTGTAQTISTTKWGAAMLTINSSGTAVLTWASPSPSTYASEALAIAALAAPAATDTVVGYITVLAAGSTWTAGTDALAGGAGGTPATTTNYYNSINPNTLMIGAASASSAGSASASAAGATIASSPVSSVTSQALADIDNA